VAEKGGSEKDFKLEEKKWNCTIRVSSSSVGVLVSRGGESKQKFAL